MLVLGSRPYKKQTNTALPNQNILPERSSKHPRSHFPRQVWRGHRTPHSSPKSCLKCYHISRSPRTVFGDRVVEKGQSYAEGSEYAGRRKLALSIEVEFSNTVQRHKVGWDTTRKEEGGVGYKVLLCSSRGTCSKVVKKLFLFENQIMVDGFTKKSYTTVASLLTGHPPFFCAHSFVVVSINVATPLFTTLNINICGRQEHLGTQPYTCVQHSECSKKNVPVDQPERHE